MKKIFVIGLALGLFACQAPESSTSESAAAPGFSLDLEGVVSDDYGMKSYVMAFLKNGPNRDQPDSVAKDLQKAHLANIRKMADEGKLVLAGPFMDNSDIKGIYLFNTIDVKEAAAWTATDPAIQAGRLTMDLKPWYGSAALLFVNDIHAEISSKSVVE